jgi:hypothetical protein
MLMFTGGLLTLMAIGGFPSFVEEMKVYITLFVWLSVDDDSFEQEDILN